MKMTLSFVVLIVLIACSSVDGGETGTPLAYYEFSSGGAYHPSGYGKWIVGLSADGTLSIRRDVRGKVTDEGSFRLTDDENERLSILFSAIDIPRVESSTRPGVPDEVQYLFALNDDSGAYTRSVWINDARENPAIMDLVDYLETIIEKYIGIKPVMR